MLSEERIRNHIKDLEKNSKQLIETIKSSRIESKVSSAVDELRLNTVAINNLKWVLEGK